MYYCRVVIGEILLLAALGTVSAHAVANVQKINPPVIQIPKDPPSQAGSPTAILVQDLVIGNEEADENASFFSLISLQVGNDGTIYALDRKDKKLKAFDSTGAFLWSKGKSGQGPWEWQGPTALWYGKTGVIAVGDFINNRISIFSPAGQPLRELPMGKWRSARIRLDGQGNIILGYNLIEPGNRILQVQRFDSSLQTGDLIVSIEEKSKPLTQFNPYMGALFFDVLPDDDIIWGYTASYEFRIVRPGGEILRIIKKDHDRVKVSEKEKEETRKEFAAPGSPPDLRLEFPVNHDAFQYFILDERGRLYVTTYETDSAGRIGIDIFDTEGRYWAKIFHPRGERLLAVRNDRLYFIESESAEGAPLVKRYRLIMK